MHRASAKVLRRPVGRGLREEAKYIGGTTKMAIEVDTNLESAIQRLTERMEECALASRTTSALLLAQKMGVDLAEPVQAQKVMRHLALVEKYVGGSSD